MINVATLSDDQLKNLMENHERLRATDQPVYGDASAEWNSRHGGSLNLDTSIAYLKSAARERRFVSYGELAQANGATWDKVRYPMNAHLWSLVKHAHHREWPMLSAMVVNKQHLTSGAMEAETLAGFAKAASDLGHEVEDPLAFLAAQQEACFAWGESA